MTVSSMTTVSTRDGTRIAVETKGEGPSVLLIPGLGYGSWSWCRQIDDLARDHEVIAINNRGAGTSDKPEGPYSIDLMAAEAADVLRSLGRDSAHLVGASMGGYIAATLAVEHSSMVKSLVLLATTVGGADCHRVPPETLAAWSAASGLAPADFARATMPLSYRDGWVDEHADEFEELLALRLEAPTPQHAWAAQQDACELFLGTGLADGDIDVPVLIVHGSADRIVPYANLATTLNRIPHAEVAQLEGAGHLCWIERADEVNTAIRAAIARAESTEEKS